MAGSSVLPGQETNLVGGVSDPALQVLFFTAAHILNKTSWEVWLWVCG